MKKLPSLLLLAGCHLGHPPPRSPGAAYRVGQVAAPVAEPGLADDVRQGLAAALGVRGGLGEGQLVEVDVLSATTEVVAIEGERRLHRARLVLEGRILGAAPTSLILRGERSFEVLATDGLGAAQARAGAFTDLSAELTADLAAWLAQAPSVAARSDPTPSLP